MMMLVRYAGSFGSGSWDAVECPYALPAGLTPPVEVNVTACVSNGQTSRMLIVSPNGKIRCANMGATGSSQGCAASLCYPLA